MVGPSVIYRDVIESSTKRIGKGVIGHMQRRDKDSGVGMLVSRGSVGCSRSRCLASDVNRLPCVVLLPKCIGF